MPLLSLPAYTNIRIASRMKPVHFLGDSRERLAGFPESVRRRIGHELYMVQAGRRPSDFKILSTIGTGALEIRVRDRAGSFRVVYVAKLCEMIFVLHAFQKKT